MPLQLRTRKNAVQTVFERLERVSDWQLFGFCLLWVVVGGLFLQLILLPYVMPQSHWGHGLIADQDSKNFHLAAIEIAESIRTQGWRAWTSAPPASPENSSVSIGIASAVYAVTWPEPWAVLPVNALLFGVAMVAVRRALAVTFDSRAIGLVALTPFFLFPSFVPIWGQLHRDLNTGTGLALVLCGLVLAGHKKEGSVHLLACIGIALAGVALLWLSREYALTLVAGGTIAFAVLALLSRRFERLRVAAVAAVVLLAAASSVVNWSSRFAPVEKSVEAPAAAPSARSAPPPAGSQSPAQPPADERRWFERIRMPTLPRIQLPRLEMPRPRYVDASVARRDNCLPAPSRRDLVDRLLYNVCHVREGFVIDSTRNKAASGYDFAIRLRTLGDFIAYSPRALAVALLEPGPRRWMTEKTPIGRLGRYFVPFEMLVAYACFVLAVVFAGRRLARLDLWAPVAFCLTYVLVYVYATAQMGTLYRMRAFAFAIVVSVALAAVLARFKAAE